MGLICRLSRHPRIIQQPACYDRETQGIQERAIFEAAGMTVRDGRSLQPDRVQPPKHWFHIIQEVP
jgi:hypothetical protein